MILARLVEKLRALNGNALVVGHGNTIPDLLKALGTAAPVSIPEDDYGELFAVVLGDTPQLAPVALLVLRKMPKFLWREIFCFP